jgi:hypothetical protein
VAVQNETQVTGTKLPIVDFIRGGLSVVRSKMNGQVIPDLDIFRKLV